MNLSILMPTKGESCIFNFKLVRRSTCVICFRSAYRIYMCTQPLKTGWKLIKKHWCYYLLIEKKINSFTFNLGLISRMIFWIKTAYICSRKRDCTHNKRLMKNMSLLAIKDGIDIIRSRDHDMNFSWNMVGYTSHLLRWVPTYIISNDSILC